MSGLFISSKPLNSFSNTVSIIVYVIITIVAFFLDIQSIFKLLILLYTLYLISVKLRCWLVYERNLSP